jgi:hypothetical protein
MTARESCPIKKKFVSIKYHQKNSYLLARKIVILMLRTKGFGNSAWPAGHYCFKVPGT